MSEKKFTQIIKPDSVPTLDKVAKLILKAQVYDAARETPITHASILSTRLKNSIEIKREDLQDVFSFKIRGAYNMMRRLSEEEKQCGVVAASAGNHAQGLAMAAQLLNVNATIIMPIVTPSIKVDAVRARGATVILKGDCFDDALAYCLEMVEKEKLTYVPPYDHLDIICGQGTIGMEILRQHPSKIDAIFVPVGGGGLITGVAAFVKYLEPSIKIIGVESQNSACLKRALEAGQRVTLSEVGVFAEGVSVGTVGRVPWSLIHAHDLVDDVITVSPDEMCAAVKDVFEDTRGVAEAAGALAVAGAKKYVRETGVEGQTLICINSGANINFDQMQYIAERTLFGEKREAIFALSFAEGKGRMMRLLEVLDRRRITECIYRWADRDFGHIYLGIYVRPDSDDREQIFTQLRAAHYGVTDLTDNELAKLHIRHLNGGTCVLDSQLEVTYRFEFPERPHSLRNFWKKLPERWNITMLHYRNHGTAYASVFVGLGVPLDERDQVSELFDNIGYKYVDETNNPAFRIFMSQGDASEYIPRPSPENDSN